MTEYTIDPTTWFSDRELDFTPKHFVVSSTPFTEESKLWVMNTLKGRFSTVHWVQDSEDMEPYSVLLSFDSLFGRPAFEDPKEAILYELTWT